MHVPEPIIILGPPRSGTSLTASIFKAHGIWVGTVRPPDDGNPKGYFENIMLTEVRYRMGHGDGLSRPLVHDLIFSDGYIEGLWLVKHSPPIWRAWRQFNPFWILVNRDTEKIVDSRIRCKQWDMTQAEHRIAVETDIAICQSIKRHIGGVEIRPDLFFSGDWSEMKKAFEYCGLVFNVDEAQACLDRSLWCAKSEAPLQNLRRQSKW